MDGTYVASMNAINGQMFDMDRVEVLRGPQGTLFGRNATGGLIHFVTRKATDSGFNGHAEATAAQFDTYSLESAVGGGLTERMRGRLAGRWETSEGYIKAGTAFGSRATGRTSGGADGVAVRGSLQIDATENVLIDLIGAYSRDRDVPSGQYVLSLAGYDPNTGLGAFRNAVDPATLEITNFTRTPITGDPWRHWSNENPYFDRETKSATAQVTAQLTDAVELVSISNGMTMDKFYIEDSGGGFGFFPYISDTEFDQWSQELRLSGTHDRVRWQAGGYYLDMSTDNIQSVQGALILGGASDSQLMTTYGKVDSTNWSVFGQLEYDLAPSWTAIVGWRRSQDDKELDLRRVYEDVPNGIAPSDTYNIHDGSHAPGLDTIDYGDYAARAQLNWRATDDTLLYVAFNRGIKGGNWSFDTLGAIADENLKHRPEKLNAYELGLKTELLDGRARLNSAVFYYDYTDYQTFSLVGLTPQVANSDAKAHGGELELTILPVAGWYVMLGAAWIDSEVDAVPDVFGGTVPAEFPSAPKFSVNALARYEWSVPAGSMAAQLDGRWNDRQYLEGTNSEVSAEPAYAVVNASLSYTASGDQFEVSLWCKNLGDKAYRIYNLDLGQLGFVQQVFAPPRQVGMTASYKW
jgi:iron complex outermembrane recepter protein